MSEYQDDGGTTEADVRRRVPNFHGVILRDLATAPDASSRQDNKYQAILGLPEFWSSISYGAALSEFNCSFLLQFISVGINVMIRERNSDGELYFTVPHLTVALTKYFIILLLTYAGANSGAHMNPNITFTTVMIGFTTVSRCIMYTVAQVLGSTAGVAVGRIAHGWDNFKDSSELGVCGIGDLSAESAFAGTAAYFWWIVFVVDGTAFDSRQAKVFGPVVGPLAITIAVAIGIVTSHKTAMMINWAECVATGIVAGEFSGYEWISIAAPTVVSIWNGIYFLSIPPIQEEGAYVPPIIEEGLVVAPGDSSFTSKNTSARSSKRGDLREDSRPRRDRLAEGSRSRNQRRRKRNEAADSCPASERQEDYTSNSEPAWVYGTTLDNV
ncbi:hypothetical protein AB1Y20_013479 [Prymnesium parvum]|uniref:Aquaporin n=1 Tax=Prymnesium parvum TaxID=97485 RepID=A0AB34IHV0_PRYPA|mmetsp:Transcript_4501/g.9843  ORF Transcript_4501/g.9843 Transcript_4501/m.9843 type:complete len:384 (-) Transcript_4501:675-1826(-)